MLKLKEIKGSLGWPKVFGVEATWEYGDAAKGAKSLISSPIGFQLLSKSQHSCLDVHPELRVDAEHPRNEPATSTLGTRPQGVLADGYADFVASINEAPEPERAMLHRLVEWAKSLQQEGLVTLSTYRGTARRWTLLPRLRADNVGLVTIWNERGGYISLYRSVFERRAPTSMVKVETLIAPVRLGQGTTIRVITEDLLTTLGDAYQEAALGQLAR